ncbi:hypothetical protein [Deinococcus sp. NW-56]|uniref:AfsR/SARP family transcriptional regulator n=1 Tax=Deinococcus sp. NW-56 TaxID=2080419 RepID=UPI000CF56B6F|nr:hypothetical protein [Deinococcus sp. NW-56]
MPEDRPVELRLLGEVRLRVGQSWVRCPDHGLRLLAVLALDGSQSRGRLADLLWATDTPRALHNLRMLLVKLRRLLGEHVGLLQDQGHHLRLDLGQLEVDVLRLTSAEVALEGTWREFMAGHRTGGPEAWLEWAERTEARLLAHAPAPPREGRPPSPCPARRSRDRAEEARWAAQDQPQLAAAAAREALALSERGEGAALALDVLIHQAIERDEYALAQHYCQQALRATPTPLADLCYTAGYLADLLGDPVGGERLALLGLAHLPPGTSPALWYATIASTYDSRQDFRTARLWHELALQAARSHPSRAQHCGVLTFFLWHLNATGDSARAQLLAAEALEQGQFSMTAYVQQSLGTAQFRLGDPEEARQTLAANCTHAVSSLAVIAGALTARIHHRLGERDQAHGHLRRTLPLALVTEDGRARFEWAVAALTCDPRHWAIQAAACVRGARTNDPLVVRHYQRLRASVGTR